MESFWQNRARRLAAQVNLGWGLALGATRLGATLLVAAPVILLVRAQGAPGAVALGLAALAVALGFGSTASAAWPRRYRRADALCRLDHDLGLGGALLAAADGVGPWPPPVRGGARLTWRGARLVPGWLFAPAVLLAALFVPLPAPAPPEGRPGAAPVEWSALKETLQDLEQEGLLDPAELDRWAEQLAALEGLPAEQRFDEETLEATEALQGQVRSTASRAARAVEDIERALAQARGADGGPRGAGEQALRRALAAADAEGLALDPGLAQQLRRLDPQDLPSMPSEALDDLRRRLAEAAAAGRAAGGEGGAEAVGLGEVRRGPGAAPIELTGPAARRLGARTARVEGRRDPARDALGDVVRVDAVPPEVDEGAYRGPRASPGTEHLGRGGDAVWPLHLDPSEQALLERYFE